MENHPIGSMMQTALENIKDMVDVNTVIGDAIDTGDGNTIIPISRVCFGFVAGGGEYGLKDQAIIKDEKNALPFSGGSGAGVSVQPVGFLVVGQDGVKMLPAQNMASWERVIQNLPQFISDIKNVLMPESAGNEGMKM